MYPGMRLLLAVLFLLVAAPAAHAGGFATVGLSSTPTGTDWPVEITVLQHGRTPLDNVTPRVVITQGATTRTFAGEPTGKPGVYAARVVFPGGGRWEYSVRDGFTDVIAAHVPRGDPPRSRRVTGEPGAGVRGRRRRESTWRCSSRACWRCSRRRCSCSCPARGAARRSPRCEARPPPRWRPWAPRS